MSVCGVPNILTLYVMLKGLSIPFFPFLPISNQPFQLVLPSPQSFSQIVATAYESGGSLPPAVSPSGLSHKEKHRLKACPWEGGSFFLSWGHSGVPQESPWPVPSHPLAGAVA